MALIALDADGVLLDYTVAYRNAWLRAFGELPAERDPNAYWSIDRWAVAKLSGSNLAHFRAQFDQEFWSSIPPCRGALDACYQLNAAGYDIVCVTAMEESFAAARIENLARFGFPIERVFATSSNLATGSPKKEILLTLAPVAFVDDFLPYLLGLPSEIHTALVLREPNGSPNIGAGLAHVNSQHSGLSDFVDWWLAR